MTKIITTNAIGGHDAGATLDVTPKVAAYLIEGGHAEAHTEAVKATRGKGKPGATESPDPHLGGASDLEPEVTAG